MNHEEIDRELGEALDSLRDVPLPDEGRTAAQHAAFLAGAREQRRLAQSAVRAPRQPWRGFFRQARWGFLRPAPAGLFVCDIATQIVHSIIGAKLQSQVIKSNEETRNAIWVPV